MRPHLHVHAIAQGWKERGSHDDELLLWLDHSSRLKTLTNEAAWRAAAAEEAASECSWSENRKAPLTQSSAGRPTPPSLQTQDKLLKLIEKSCKDASGVTAVTATTLPYSNKISEFSR